MAGHGQSGDAAQGGAERRSPATGPSSAGGSRNLRDEVVERRSEPENVSIVPDATVRAALGKVLQACAVT